jgi:hypothetical protein
MFVSKEIHTYFLFLVCENPGGEDCIEEESATTSNKRLQRMKVQSRKTFKFRKTRKREREVMNCTKYLIYMVTYMVT